MGRTVSSNKAFWLAHGCHPGKGSGGFLTGLLMEGKSCGPEAVGAGQFLEFSKPQLCPTAAVLGRSLTLEGRVSLGDLRGWAGVSLTC